VPTPFPFVDDCSLRIATWRVSYQGLVSLSDIFGMDVRDFNEQRGAQAGMQERVGAKVSSWLRRRTTGCVYGVMTDFD
jgi:hypothetical protein